MYHFEPTDGSALNFSLSYIESSFNTQNITIDGENGSKYIYLQAEIKL